MEFERDGDNERMNVDRMACVQVSLIVAVAVWCMQATTLSEEHERELKKLFDDYDQNGSGDIDIDELRDIAEDLGEPLSEIELQYLQKEFDCDQRQRVDAPGRHSPKAVRTIYLCHGPATATAATTLTAQLSSARTYAPTKLAARLALGSQLAAPSTLYMPSRACRGVMSKRERAAPILHDDGFTINGCAFHVDPKYKPIDAIGQGSYGVVCSVKNTETNEKLAIKKITPMAGDEWDATHTLREIRLMRCLGEHENIISLKDLSMCEEKDELYMMMELADTDLHRLIQSSCPLTEGHIRVIMFQVLSGVKAMHDNEVLHRDLKPGNLLLNKDCELKITDFGLARMMPKDQQHHDVGADASVVSPMTEYVVTRWYRPPELMLAPNGCYDGAVDMWSVGCILGELISRKPMFPGTDFMDQLTRVFKVIPIPEKDKRGYYIEKDALKFLSSLPTTAPNALENMCKNVTPLALDLMQKLLCFNPKERISADEALAHAFFDGVKEEWGEILPLKLGHSLEFAFENQSLPLATLRKYICDEVRAFREKDEAERIKRAMQAQTQEAASSHETAEADYARQGKTAPTAAAGPAPQAAPAPQAQPAKARMSLENDCPAGRGFTIKGCEFNVPSNYRPLQVLGEGSYGIVCAASDAASKKTVAIKKITPMAGDEWDAKHTLREIRLMRYFGHHPNIASLQNLSTCVEKDELYLMMDLVDTDLHRLIQSKTKLEEAHIAAIMYQILCGAKTLHENGVLHRDLKPGNILVSKNCDAKITDFGLSRYVPQGSQPTATKIETENRELMTEYVVTRWYRPPEIMLAPNGCYNDAVDMWSIGCIFGELLNRRPLFPGTDFIDQLTKVFSMLPVPPREKRGYVVEGDALKFLESLPPCSPSAITKTFRKASPEAVSLLRRLLCINPERRISAKQALAHPYFKNIRHQLGEPPEFRVAKEFDFDFDKQNFALSHLRQLIQDEVRLLQQERHAPAPQVRYGAAPEPDKPAEVPAAKEPAVAAPAPVPAPVATQAPAPVPVQAPPSSASSCSPCESILVSERSGARQEDDDSSVASTSLDSKDGVPIVPTEFLSKPASTEKRDRVSTSQQDKQAKEREQKPEFDDDNGKGSVSVSSASSDSEDHDHKQHASDDDDHDDDIRVEHATTRRVYTRADRPKSAGPRRQAAAPAQHHQHHNQQQRSPSDEDQNGHDDLHGARWGQPRSSAAAVAAVRAGIAADKKRTPTSLAATSRSSSSSNQTSARDRDEKVDGYRHPERAPIQRTTTVHPSKSSALHDLLPEGWVKRIHSKSGREYYYDTQTRVSTWKHPSKLVDAPLPVPTANKTTEVPAPVAVLPGTRRNSLSATTVGGSGALPLSGNNAAALANAQLPKDWERRTDPKTGRLFYVNLITKKAFASLPSSVSASILNMGKETKRHEPVKKKVTVPQSPQFSQMSWQRKKAQVTMDEL
ncbi:TPA: hypothetical protein N0F65_010450 [Lagenidium giganteum]|uniref:Mitogen-activated protein kinase n=1 Tax=Lagenidium giganteum TaxID=4803 RepID=A0AAV2YR31_9STRA|nr:TPA: hypothetical protein N0F65_010450 [Lagenidium giganteum]